MKKFIAVAAAAVLMSWYPATDSQPEGNSATQGKGFDLANLDTKTKPCDDFYQYAIGGWLANNPVPSTESRWSSFNVLAEANNANLKAIMMEFSAAENAAKGSMEQMIGDLFSSAMDSTKANELGISPLKAELKVIEDAQSIADLSGLSAHLRTIGVSTLFSLYVGQDDKDSESYITQLYQSGLGLPDRDYYLKEGERSVEIRDGYVDHLAKIFVLAGEDAATAEQSAKTVMEIETKLATASMTRVERRDPDKTYNKFSYAELDGMTKNIRWDNYFSTLGLKGVDQLILAQPDFIKAVDAELSNTPLANWKVYFKWHLIDAYVNYLSADFVDQNFDFFSRQLRGTEEMRPRWKRALSWVNGNLGQLVGQAYVKRHFSEDSKAEVGRMVENLREVFKERVRGLEWMSEETKPKALEKLNSFNKKIGYPDKWRDYSTLEIKEGELVANVMKARKFNYAYMINKLGKPVDKGEWFMTPQTVNAYYSSSKNEVVFPAGILQPPFYNPEADIALNYGGIGAVIGHEFSHGFDDQGSKYDAQGNLENWWTDEDRKQFEARAQYVVDQFNRFEPLDSLFVNGNLTLGENIADLGGLTLAYYAMEKDVAENGAPEDIDGFNYKQRFFLGWAQVWHMNMKEAELRRRIVTDPHSPGQYRVNGPLANMSEFANCFACKEGDAMVAPDSLKAVIW